MHTWRQNMDKKSVEVLQELLKTYNDKTNMFPVVIHDNKAWQLVSCDFLSDDIIVWNLLIRPTEGEEAVLFRLEMDINDPKILQAVDHFQRLVENIEAMVNNPDFIDFQFDADGNPIPVLRGSKFPILDADTPFDVKYKVDLGWYGIIHYTNDIGDPVQLFDTNNDKYYPTEQNAIVGVHKLIQESSF